MSVNTVPPLNDIVNRIRQDFRSQLPTSNPFLKNSFANAYCVATGGATYDLYQKQQVVLNNLYIDTATDITYVEYWGSYRKLFPNPASPAQGNALIQGTVNTPIPSGTGFQSSAGISYETRTAAIIQNSSIGVLSLSSITGIATATTAEPHNLATGITVTITGAFNANYNTTGVITVIDPNSFEYPIIGSAPPEDTGAIINYIAARLLLISLEFGSNTNVLSGEALNITVPIPGANASCYADFFGISGGTDQESLQQYQDRVKFAYQNPATPFNKSGIELTAKQVPGVTRVFVFEVTPGPGQVTVYFMRDNDANPIPSPIQVQAVKNQILTIKPAHTISDDVIVSAPTPLPVDFVFLDITPDTGTMKEAIISNLQAFFTDTTSVGTSIPGSAYIAAIFDTVDTTTGESLQDFTLNTPTGTINVNSHEIPILGNVNFL